MSSLFDAVEMAPRDPILGLNEQFAADPNPGKVNLGVGVYYDENGKLPLLRCVRAAEEKMMEAPQAARLPADRRHRRLRRGDPGARVRRRQPERCRERPRRHRPGGGRDRRAQGRRRPAAADEPSARVLISDPSWENHRALFESAGFEVETYPYYDAATHGVDFDGMCRRSPGRRARNDRRPARLLPQPDRLRPHARAVAAGRRPCSGAHRLVPFLDMAYQGFGEGIAEDGRAVAALPRRRARLLRRDQLLQELLALRRARRRAVGRLCPSKEAAARVPQPAQARHPHQLLQPADARRGGRRHGLVDAGAARALGGGARRDARADQAHARRAAAPPRRRRRSDRHRLHHPTARHVQLLGPQRGHRCSGCAASSGFTASIPAASAWPP